MQFSVHAAKSQLSKLIDAALRGEEVVIAKGSKPVVRLTPIPQSGFRLGVLPSLEESAPDFLEPLSEEETALWEGRWVHLLLDTHAWAWSLWDDLRLSRPARDAMARADVVRVSPISFFEIGQKVRIGKWPEMAPFVADLPDRLKEQGGQVADLTMEAALLASQLDWDHHDPFDRLIAATAALSDAVLISADTMFDTLTSPHLHRIWGWLSHSVDMSDRASPFGRQEHSIWRGACDRLVPSAMVGVAEANCSSGSGQERCNDEVRHLVDHVLYHQPAKLISLIAMQSYDISAAL